MTLEEELFQKTKVDVAKLVAYGFKKEQSLYRYSKKILQDTFQIDVEVHADGTVKGKVYDLSFQEEYTQFRIPHYTGSFVGEVKEAFETVLKDIRSHCFIREIFQSEQANRIGKALLEKYGDEPEFEWEKFPRYAIFRNKESHKWYGIIMNIDRSKLKAKATGEVEIMNIKLAPAEITSLLQQAGFYPAYHMNKKNWITVVLDDTVSDEALLCLIEKSHFYAVPGQKRSQHEWILPANPKYFDIEEALKEKKTILWKQSTHMQVDDIVYLYVAEPYAAILYQFKVTKVDIPYDYQDANIKMTKGMELSLLHRYEKGKFSRSQLKKFGVNAVRGPRYMPAALSDFIKHSH